MRYIYIITIFVPIISVHSSDICNKKISYFRGKAESLDGGEKDFTTGLHRLHKQRQKRLTASRTVGDYTGQS